jgi:hypothetical protein
MIRLLVIALLLLASAARAQSPAEVDRARAHFDAGHAYFKLGQWAAALRQFSDGYKLVPKPRFLVNLGHCYRKLGEPIKAREMFTQFLSEVAADDPDRAEVTQLLAEIDQALPPPPAAAPPPVATPPPVAAPPPLAEPLPIAAPPPVAAPVTTAAVAAPVEQAPRGKVPLRKWVWAIPVGAALVVGLAVGIGVGTAGGSGDTCKPGAIACFDLR